jgi:hypothetical protein
LLELRERLKAERQKFLKPYFDLRRSVGASADIQRLADFIYVPNLRKVEDEVVVSDQLTEIRRYLLQLKNSVERFDQGVAD